MMESTGQMYAERDELKDDDAFNCFRSTTGPRRPGLDVFTAPKVIGNHELEQAHGAGRQDVPVPPAPLRPRLRHATSPGREASSSGASRCRNRRHGFPGSQQFDQLVVYMTPREIIKAATSRWVTDRRPQGVHGGSVGAQAVRGAAAASRRPVRPSSGPQCVLAGLRGPRRGVRAPVHLGADGQVHGGHHRLAAAAAVDPNQPVPVMLHSGTGAPGSTTAVLLVTKEGSAHGKGL